MAPAAPYIRPCGAGSGLAGRQSLTRRMDSPCIKLCVMDAATGLCAGCGRSLEEIAGWAGMSELERRRVMRELPGRRSRTRPAAER